MWLAILSLLVALLMALVGWLGRITWAKVATLEERIASSDFAAFKGMDTEREKQWEYWRAVVDKRLDEKKATLKDHEHRLTRLERNGAH